MSVDDAKDAGADMSGDVLPDWDTCETNDDENEEKGDEDCRNVRGKALRKGWVFFVQDMTGCCCSLCGGAAVCVLLWSSVIEHGPKIGQVGQIQFTLHRQ